VLCPAVSSAGPIGDHRMIGAAEDVKRDNDQEVVTGWALGAALDKVVGQLFRVVRTARR
jgi:hypothetical protein